VLLDEVGRSDAPQTVSGMQDYWYKVTTPGGKTGWVFGGLTLAADPSHIEDAYLRVARDRADNGVEELSFADWIDYVAFLTRAAPQITSPEARGEVELLRLSAIGSALAATPFDKQDAAPYKPWRDSVGTGVVYSEPAGRYFVEAEEYWKLAAKYASTGIGERIAFDAANIPLPGECEGDFSCEIAAYNISLGRYLKLYPKGEHAADALRLLVDMLGGVGGESTGLELPTDEPYKGETRKDLAETRAIVSGATGAKRDEALRLIDAVDAKLK
jgi:hypothetical protein